MSDSFTPDRDAALRARAWTLTKIDGRPQAEAREIVFKEFGRKFTRNEFMGLVFRQNEAIKLDARDIRILDDLAAGERPGVIAARRRVTFVHVKKIQEEAAGE